MTSKIKVDNINKVSDDSNIIKKCGTTTTIGSGASNPIVVDGSAVTLGRCGGTVALASGATQTGFGRTGTVNWVTTKKTANFTAVSGEGYFCDTAAVGAFTLTLPSSPSAGDIVGLKDYNGNFATANLTIGRGGSPINGGSSINPVLNTDGTSLLLVYVDGTQGWVPTNDDTSTLTGADFIVATGGTISCVGGFRMHTFTGPGTFSVSAVSSTAPFNNADYIIVGGGGAGGSGAFGEGGGGGGAGGYRESPGTATCYTASPRGASPAAAITLAASPGSYPIVVGGGGSGGSGPGGCGVASSFASITGAVGGGGGGHYSSPTTRPGKVGGSGGGGAGQSPGGSGNEPPVNPAQGTQGADGAASPSYSAGGGGGATVAGTAATNPSPGGAGGAGATSGITGSPVAYAGGGGGSAGQPAFTGGAGGTGGGGAGAPASPNTQNGTNGTAATGGGGGGGGSATPAGVGGSGGGGVVIIRYKNG